MKNNLKRLQEADQKDLREIVRAVRWTKEQWAEVESAAKKAGMQPSRFIRACTLSQAREITKK